jgi:hypothetical protein
MNVKKDIKKIFTKIAVDEDKFEYELMEELLKEKYPSYFKK